MFLSFICSADTHGVYGVLYPCLLQTLMISRINGLYAMYKKILKICIFLKHSFSVYLINFETVGFIARLDKYWAFNLLRYEYINAFDL